MRTEPRVIVVPNNSKMEQIDRVQPRPTAIGNLWWVVTGLALLYFLTARPIADSEAASRNLFGLVAALATERSVAIDHFVTSSSGGFLTANNQAFNLAYFDGHYFSDTAPGSAILTVPFYQLGRLFGADGPDAFGLGLVALSGAATVLMIYAVARRLGSSRASSRYAALTLGLGSALWREAGRFGPGVFSMLLLGLALWLALPPLPCNAEDEGGPKLRAGRAVWLGLALGFAPVVDYPNLLWLPLFVVYLLFNRPATKGGWAGLIGGGLVGILPLAIYNWAAVGKPWAFTYGFLLNEPQANTFGGQFLSLNLARLRDGLFGPGRGLLGPFVFLFGIWGLIALYGQRGKRRETLFFATLIGAILIVGLFRRPLGEGNLTADFVVTLLIPLVLGVAVWYERYMFLTRIEQPWLPWLALGGTALYYLIGSPGPFANFGAWLYLLPLIFGVGLVWLVWRYTPRFSGWQKVGAGLAGLALLGIVPTMTGEVVHPAFAESGPNNLLYNPRLECENSLRAGWYLQSGPLTCDSGSLNLKAGQRLQPYLVPVQGGKVYHLGFQASGGGRLEWLWSAEPATIDGLKFTNSSSQDWKSGLVEDNRAAPPGAAYLQLNFTPAADTEISDFRLYDDSVRVEPMKDYARAALSFTFDWETAMGGLVHSKGGAPIPGEGEYGGLGLSENNLQLALADAVRRGLDMRRGADYLLELFSRFGVRGTFYANGYNLLDGNRDNQKFIGDPTYRWAAPKNGWNSDFWLKNPWYSLDPHGDFQSDPAWYFGDQADRLRQARQDIQSHTFGHIYVRGTTPEEFLRDTDAFGFYAAERKLPPIRHFAFPWKSSNSLTAEWYQILVNRGYTSVTRLYDADQGIRQDGVGLLAFDNGQRTPDRATVVYENFAGPSNTYYYLGRVRGAESLLVLRDYQLVPGERSEATAKALLDELLRRRGYGSIWTHPEAIVDAGNQGQWMRVVQYAAQKREAGLWVDSVANIVQHRLNIAQVKVAASWSNGGKKARLVITNHAKEPISGLTLTLPAPLKSATGATSFKGAQLLVPPLQVNQSVTIEVEV